METTFITIHDLSAEAVILYASDSIVDILGHTPDEVVNRSSWDFFHPNEVQTAMNIHEKGVDLDKAAVLSYCQIRNRQGYYVTCECCFSVCYDVMVCCTSIYRHGFTSQKRAVEAPIVRRMFSSSPKDPRYHMLTHLSRKFELSYDEQSHEPRAALFLNRFTRTLTVMYATSGIEEVVGISGEEMKGKSFYYCIAENCLEDAVKCLETAKGNDSIAYLRFMFRDPRTEDRAARDGTPSDDTDVAMTDMTSEDNSEAGATASSNDYGSSGSTSQSHRPGPAHDSAASTSRPSREASSRSATNGHSTSNGDSASATSSNRSRGPIELEAVVSCTSDGLVVCLRRARAMMPQAAPTVPNPATMHPQTQYGPGVFAAPWGINPILPAPYPQTPYIPAGPGHVNAAGNVEPQPPADFLKAISDVAVFAWALTGINGSLSEFGRGEPKGESAPVEGFAIWRPGEMMTPTDGGPSSLAGPPQTPGSGYVSGSPNEHSSGNSRDRLGGPPSASFPPGGGT